MNAALGIDTSCYVTSCALVGSDLELIASQRKTLAVKPGTTGLRQSEAFFEHVRQFPGVFADTVRAGPGVRIAAVCASDRPSDREASYMPVFLAGAAFAQTLSSALAVPCFRTTHQRGHIAAAAIGRQELPDPCLCVHLSGGTTEVLLLRGGEPAEVLASSLDLHAGQLVDRLGVLLGLPFPSGPLLEELARQGTAAGRYPVRFTDAGCHLSGAEAQAAADIADGKLHRQDIAAEIFDALSRCVLKMLSGAAGSSGVRVALVTGGVASSALLREMMALRNAKRRLGLELLYGRPELAGDNAAGVALIGARRAFCLDGGHLL